MAARLAAMYGNVRSAARRRLCGARARAEQGVARREAGAWRRSSALVAAEALVGGGAVEHGRGAAAAYRRLVRGRWFARKKKEDMKLTSRARKEVGEKVSAGP